MAKISDDTQVALFIERNILSMIVQTCNHNLGYFGIVERLNNLETEQTLMSNDLEKNTEFVLNG